MLQLAIGSTAVSLGFLLATVMGGLADDRATLDELDAWRIHTTAEFERETFPGGHFFVQTARAEVLGSLARRLSRIAAVP